VIKLEGEILSNGLWMNVVQLSGKDEFDLQ